ncbi:MAG: hypothetical protein GX591_02175 [Planctomycetes bacterium]|nr:hypothetical protein [Planctomycetota bacterium]
MWNSVLMLTLLAVAFSMPACRKAGRGTGDGYPVLTSPSGTWRALRATGRRPGDTRDVWAIGILDDDGNLVFEDQTDFVALLNIHLGWDDGDRLWLYNSDDGRLYYYARGHQGWKRTAYDKAMAEGPDPLAPPVGFLPEHARKHWTGDSR